MKVLLKKFYGEPVFALAIVEAAVVAAAVKVTDPLFTLGAAVVVAVCEVAKRQLVSPEYEVE